MKPRLYPTASSFSNGERGGVERDTGRSGGMGNETRAEDVAAPTPDRTWREKFDAAKASLDAGETEVGEHAMRDIVEGGDVDVAPFAAYFLGISRLTAPNDETLAVLGFAYRSGHPAAARLAAYPYGRLLASAGRLDEAAAVLAMAARVKSSRIDASLAASRVHLLRDAPGEAALMLFNAVKASEDTPDPDLDGEEWFKTGLAFDARRLTTPAALSFEIAARSAHPRISRAAALRAAGLYATEGQRRRARSMRRLHRQLCRQAAAGVPRPRRFRSPKA